MTGYEVMFVVKSGLGEDAYRAMVESTQNWITKNDGKVLSIELLGERDIPTAFNKKHTKGVFIQCQFEGNNKTLENLRHQFQVNENILRHMIVLLSRITAEEEAS